MTSQPPSSFTLKKSRILQALSVPISEYDDFSPKGSIDVGIRELIDEINALEGCVTTSSCAGRISVFLEGKRKLKGAGGVERGIEAGEEGGDRGEEEGVEGKRESGENERTATAAGVGGKGGGGRWLFVSHDPVAIRKGLERSGSESGSGEGRKSCGGKDSWTELMGMQRLEGRDEEVQALMESSRSEKRLVHFKFEPMILHILTASLQQAQLVLSAALQAGFRESGALNLTPSSGNNEPPIPMVGIRSMGLALESVIGFEDQGREICMVPEWQLRHMIEVSNQRFVENTKRIERFRTLLLEMSESGMGKERKGDGREWEDAGARRERKKAEGMRRAEELRVSREMDGLIGDTEEVLDLDSLDQNS
ncbi:related to DUF207 domain protein [Rhynchosporium agropyri]|uniref:tRNA(Phe) 7-[(3-amino-3-carboxypropyl)-4-demethylwyosine(37)-N(4)]-methyltransferase n=1 Tax=Rhynchosporium agropyri TaxID=914238 RepID=A0A1E1KSJ0_9HELO|nr:related to DUF207 domain protein [Rhynchosporium agropyri]